VPPGTVLGLVSRVRVRVRVVGVDVCTAVRAGASVAGYAHSALAVRAKTRRQDAREASDATLVLWPCCPACHLCMRHE